MRIRRVEARDRDAVRSVLVAAFPSDDEARVAAGLRAAGALLPELSFVAEVGDAVAGVALASRASAGGRPAVAIGPVAVLPRFQRRGVGTALVRSQVLVAGHRGEHLIGVVGEPAFYARVGFAPGAGYGLAVVPATWQPVFQTLALPCAAPGLRGPFRYSSAFSASAFSTSAAPTSG